MAVIKLFYKEKSFIEATSGGEMAILELDEDHRKAKLLFVPKTSVIEKRTAERQAQSICKTGYLLQNGRRIGSGFTLEIKSED